MLQLLRSAEKFSNRCVSFLCVGPWPNPTASFMLYGQWQYILSIHDSSKVFGERIKASRNGGLAAGKHIKPNNRTEEHGTTYNGTKSISAEWGTNR